MRLQVDQRLFWFLKEGATLDLSKPADLDLYVQQVLSRGTSKDVTSLLVNVPAERFKQTFLKVKRFLPGDVRNFWEDFLRDYHADPGSHP